MLTATSHSPDEVLAVAAESRLFEESSGELVVADLDHVLESQSASTLVPRRHAGTVVAISRVRQSTTRVAADAHSGVHRSGQDARSLVQL